MGSLAVNVFNSLPLMWVASERFLKIGKYLTKL